MATEAKVAGHYRRGQLEETILRAMAQMGKDTAHLVASDLAPIDEFHVGGLEATQAVAAHMDLCPGLRLPDVGSGIGGSARAWCPPLRKMRDSATNLLKSLGRSHDPDAGAQPRSRAEGFR